MEYRARFNQKRGIAMLELVIVVVVMAVISALLVGVYSRFVARQGLNAAAETTYAMLGKARSRTLASQDSTSTGTQYGIHFDSATKQIRLFQYSTGAPQTLTVEETYTIPGEVTMSAICISGNAQPDPRPEIYFKRITGEAQRRTAGNALQSVAAVAACSPTSPNGALVQFTAERINDTRIITVRPTGVIATLP